MHVAREAKGKVVGGILVLLGIVAIVEGVRLHALRTEMVAGAVGGDDTSSLLRTGDRVRVDPPAGRVEVWANSRSQP